LRKQALVSIRLFRQVKIVHIAEDAGSDMAALTIEEASRFGGTVRKPYRVLAPYRFYTGALRYNAANPDVRLVVLGGRAAMPGQGPAVFIRTDFRTDLYRAGQSAAVLAGEGRILFYQDRNMSDSERAAFLQGLGEQGYTGEPLFLGLNSDDNSFNGVSCAVLAGAAASFLNQTPGIPLIVFSWLDPAVMPPNVKLVFDDSPWASALEAVKVHSANSGESMPIPSDIQFAPGNNLEMPMRRLLSEISRKKLY
jgi:hypothetical protein